MGNRDCDGESLCGKQKLKISSHDYQPLDSVFASSQAKYYLASGSRTMLNFGAVGGVNRSGNGRSFDQEESGDEYLDEYFSQPEKKRRLSVDQVQFLERSFEAENKLEPERRTQLAKDLGLQPRQVAIWFQNRRARWKTRQLETDYETLHSSYKKLKTDYDNLMKENEMLKTEVLHLKQNGLPQGTEKANPKELHEAMPNEAIPDMISEDGEANVSELAFKDEEQSSVKSDSNNLDSPWLTNGINSSQLESGDSSHFLEPGQSGLSQNGEDDFKGELFQLDYIVPKIEDARCHPPPSSFYYGFPVEDHAFSFWSY